MRWAFATATCSKLPKQAQERSKERRGHIVCVIFGHVRTLARVKVFMAPAGRRRWWRQETLGRLSAVRSARGVRAVDDLGCQARE